MSDRRRMNLTPTPTLEAVRCRSLPPPPTSMKPTLVTSTPSPATTTKPTLATSTPIDAKTSSAAITTSYKVTGQLHSWRSGDIKILLKSEEMENEKNLDNRRDAKSTRQNDPISKVFGEKSPKFETRLPEPEVDKVRTTCSGIPTSSQLVRSMEQSFKNAAKEQTGIDTLKLDFTVTLGSAN